MFNRTHFCRRNDNSERPSGGRRQDALSKLLYESGVVVVSRGNKDYLALELCSKWEGHLGELLHLLAFISCYCALYYILSYIHFWSGVLLCMPDIIWFRRGRKGRGDNAQNSRRSICAYFATEVRTSSRVKKQTSRETRDLLPVEWSCQGSKLN